MKYAICLRDTTKCQGCWNMRRDKIIRCAKELISLNLKAKWSSMFQLLFHLNQLGTFTQHLLNYSKYFKPNLTVRDSQRRQLIEDKTMNSLEFAWALAKHHMEHKAQARAVYNLIIEQFYVPLSLSESCLIQLTRREFFGSSAVFSQLCLGICKQLTTLTHLFDGDRVLVK